MPITNPVTSSVNPKDVVIIQRANDNKSYGEIHISGSDLIFYTDSQGYLNADKSSSFYSSFPPPSTSASLVVGGTYPITASWAVTASFAMNGGGSGTTILTGSTLPITASWAINLVSESVNYNHSLLLMGG